MHSILTTTVTLARPRFATLTRMKQELDVTTNDTDDLLAAKLEEASSDIQLALGFRVPREANVETFRHDDPLEQWFSGSSSGNRAVWVVEPLFLKRKAVAAVTSVVLDDTTMSSGEYVLDGDRDALIRLDTSGYPCAWTFSKSIVVTYTAGYILPGTSGANLPPTIESMVVELVTEFWSTRGQNPRVKSETIPGVASYDYWVGAVGDPEQLPPGVQAKLALMRRPRMAVA